MTYFELVILGICNECLATISGLTYRFRNNTKKKSPDLFTYPLLYSTAKVNKPGDSDCLL